ncbi:MAG: fatty acid desaturase, partial [Verrucomicrobiota bacterium]
AVVFELWRSKAGHPWLFTVPVWMLAAGLIGCLQHRIALLGHEASHLLLHPNRKVNDICADLFCFFPIFASLAQYRAKHLPHHLHPNDQNQDPNLGSGKAERLYAQFPLDSPKDIRRYYWKFFWPPFVLRNLLDLVSVASIGSGTAPDFSGKRRLTSILGLVYFVSLIVVVRAALYWQQPVWAVIGSFGVLCGGIALSIPRSKFYTSARSHYSVKLGAVIRIAFYAMLIGTLGQIAQSIGWDPTLAYLSLWVFPLIYLFPYLMLLRELYQHANAGVEQLDNSRIIHADPFTRWALLGYGNDFHLVHHLYPNIPHYRLKDTHTELMERSETYRAKAETTDDLAAALAKK